MKINRLWVIMSSKKEIFESYLGKLGLNKTALEAVKDINGVLFEGIDDLLDEMGSETDDSIEVSSVPEQLSAEPETPAIEQKNEQEATGSDKEYKVKVNFDDALSFAFKWAHHESRFDNLWNEYNSVDPVSFMVPSNDGGHEFLSKDKVMYVINAAGESDDVPKYTYPTATNPVKMSDEVHKRVEEYYGEGDLGDVTFEEIKHWVLGNEIHQSGEEVPSIGIECTIEIDPSATVLATNVDGGDLQKGIVPNQEKRNALSEEYGLPVENFYTALLNEWLSSNKRYYRDDATGDIYDTTPMPTSKADFPTMAAAKKGGKKESSLALNMKVIDWAKTQDKFKLLLKPNSAGVPKLVYSNTIYKVPNDGSIEGIAGNTPYVYMDDDNYASYVNGNPGFDQSKVQKFGVDALNTIVSTEYKERSLSDTSSANAYGYDENGWVNNLECELVDYGVYALKRGIDVQIRKAFGRNIDGLNNYVAGKNIVTIGGKQDLDGNVTGGIDCHPLVFLDRTSGGYLKARLVALFDESCCKPGESLSKIVGVDGLRRGTPTIQGFATILNNCNLEKSGPFVINECILSNVDISGSTGFVKIGTRGNAPKKTIIRDTVIAVGNNGADQMLPNNRMAAEMSGDMRGVSIINSEILDSVIENGYADIENCHIKNLAMSNEGPKRLKGWDTEDASNVEFRGSNLISISGRANYRKGMVRSVVAGAKSTFEYESGNVVTNFTGDVVLDSSAGTVVCSGSTMENVIANGPCNIRTCNLKGTTVGVNAEAGGDFAMTDMNCVNTNPASEGAGTIRIEHGRDHSTVFGNSKKDKTSGMIQLSGRVFVEGGAQVFKSIISSADDSQETYVRGNMVLNDCTQYSLNRQDSGKISTFLHGDAVLSGDCTDAVDVARKLQLGFNVFGGSSQSSSPIEKYEQFKDGDLSLKDLTIFESSYIVDEFLKQNTDAVLMNKSVFMDITEGGEVVARDSLKTTIWDPVGGFFVGAVNQKENGEKVYGPMILLKCPNVVLDHQAIIRKKKEFGQSVDFDMYASGKVTLRQYVEFLESNGYDDCFQYVKDENGNTGSDFVQLCLISKKDKRTPITLSMDQMKILEANAKRVVNQFVNTDTTSATTLHDVDTIDNITSAYTDKYGRMVIETDRGKYEYSAPRVNDVGNKIQSTCSRTWRTDDGKTQHSTTTVDCGMDSMYKAGYQYLLNSHTSANAQALDLIRRALSGNTEGLAQHDYLSSAVNALSGNEMKSDDADMVDGDVYNKIMKLISLGENEKVYYMEAPNMVFLAKGKRMALPSAERLRYENAGCVKMRYWPIEYDKDSGRFIVKDSHVYPVKMRNNLKSSPVQMEHMLAREATLDDFIRLLGVPDPRV